MTINPALIVISWLLLLLPFHTVFIDGYFRIYLFDISFWKEIAILILIALAILRGQNGQKKQQQLVLLAALSILIILTADVAIDFEQFKIPALRTYVLPPFLTWAILSLRIGSANYRYLVNLYLFSVVISVLYALTQVFILGESFLLNIGFPENIWNSEKLRFTFYIHGGEVQRANGGFAGPIMFALYLLPAVFISADEYNNSGSYKSLSLLLIGLVGITATMLRSAVLAGLVVLVFHYSRPKTVRVLLAGLSIGTACVLVWVTFYGFPDSVLNTLVSFLSISTGGFDPSLIGHLNSYSQGWELFLESPILGKGIGSVSPASANYIFNLKVIESTYLSLLVELGLIRSLIYISYWVLIYKLSVPGSITRKILLALFIVGFFLPVHYYFELICILSILIAIDIQKAKNNA